MARKTPPPPAAPDDAQGDSPVGPAIEPDAPAATANSTPTNTPATSTPAMGNAAIGTPPPHAVPPASPYAGAPLAAPSTLSVLALVLGIIGLVLSFFFIGLLPAIAGVILGHLALKREPHARGMAIAGLVTGYVGIAISVLWGLIVLVPFVLLWLAVGAAGVWSTF